MNSELLKQVEGAPRVNLGCLAQRVIGQMIRINMVLATLEA